MCLLPEKLVRAYELKSTLLLHIIKAGIIACSTQKETHLKRGHFSDSHGLEAGLPDFELELLSEDELHRLVPSPAVVENFILAGELGHEVKLDSGAVR